MSVTHANWSVEEQLAAARGEHHSHAVIDIQADGVADWAYMYGAALLQAMAVYYGVAVFLHFVVPALADPHRVQHGEVQASEDTRRDARRALIPVCCLVCCVATPHCAVCVCVCCISPPLALAPPRSGPSRCDALSAVHMATE